MWRPEGTQRKGPETQLLVTVLGMRRKKLRRSQTQNYIRNNPHRGSQTIVSLHNWAQ